jgi:hypothetical protein
VDSTGSRFALGLAFDKAGIRSRRIVDVGRALTIASLVAKALRHKVKRRATGAAPSVSVKGDISADLTAPHIRNDK